MDKKIILNSVERYLCLILMFVALLMTSSQLYALSHNGVKNGGALIADQNGVYGLALYKSGVISIGQNVKRISVGNPGIADILILRNKELYVVGKALGSTNITVWNSKGQIIGTYEIMVTHDLDTLKVMLHNLLPDEKIGVRSAQESIVLSGQVSNLVKMQAAVDLAKNFLPECIEGASTETKVGGGIGEQCKQGEVLNLMQVSGAQQVMLEVKVAEVSRQLLRRLDSKFNLYNGGKTSGGVVSGGTTFTNLLDEDGLFQTTIGGFTENSIAGPPIQYLQPPVSTIADKGIFLSHLKDNWLATAIIEASKEKGLGKVLAEPTLVTLTGQEAEFLSGGEFPIPVSSGDGKVTVKFKEFGVGLKFRPIVLDSGNINMELNVGVSELSSQNSIGVGVNSTSNIFAIPSLTKRNVSSTVELADGQTMGIAGLLNDNTRALVNRLPGIGDVPVLGALFSSQEYISGQTELVIFITPHLAKPIAKDKIKLPTDSYMAPDDMEFYLLGKLQARPENSDEMKSEEAGIGDQSVIRSSNGTTAVSGSYGHSL